MLGLQVAHNIGAAAVDDRQLAPSQAHSEAKELVPPPPAPMPLAMLIAAVIGLAAAAGLAARLLLGSAVASGALGALAGAITFLLHMPT